MWPIIFSVGFFNLRTLSVLSAIAFLVTGFVLWKKGKEEHYVETILFDGYLSATLFGFLIGRLAFVLLNHAQFGWDLMSWLDLMSKPGIQPLASLVATTLFMANFASRKKWDVFEILDFWSIAATAGMVITYIGYFLDGSVIGKTTSMPWGIVLPGVFEKTHPVPLYFALFIFLLCRFLSWAEYHYRTFEWYRFGKKTAQTGFLFCVFLIAFSSFSLLMSLVSLPEITINNFVLDQWLYIVFLVYGLWLLWRRSGRTLGFGASR